MDRTRTETTPTGLGQEAFETFLSTRLEPCWLTELRRNAWKAFLELPLPQDQPPGPKQEEWRRTDIRRCHLEKFPLPDYGSGEQGAGSGEQGAGSREQGAGSREQGGVPSTE